MDVLLGFAFAILIVVAIIWVLGVTMKSAIVRHEERRLKALGDQAPDRGGPIDDAYTAGSGSLVEVADTPDPATFVEIAYTPDPAEARVWARFLEDRGVRVQLELRAPEETPPGLLEKLGMVFAIALGAFWWLGTAFFRWSLPGDEREMKDIVALRVPGQDARRAKEILESNRLVRP